MPSLTLSLLDETYAVCRLPPNAPVDLVPRGSYAAVVHAPEETTLVCSLGDAPPHAQVDPGWRCLRIEETFAFSMPGILASVLGPLAEAGIGIFATSTFSTDYVLVKAGDLEHAVEALRKAGHTVAP